LHGTNDGTTPIVSLTETTLAPLTRPLAATRWPRRALLASAPRRACPRRTDSRPSRSSVRFRHPSSKDVPEGVRASLESRPTLISSTCARFCGSLSSILLSRSLRRGSHSSGSAGLPRSVDNDRDHLLFVPDHLEQLQWRVHLPGQMSGQHAIEGYACGDQYTVLLATTDEHQPNAQKSTALPCTSFECAACLSEAWKRETRHIDPPVKLSGLRKAGLPPDFLIRSSP
jgi:hypothetical protein